MRPSLVFNVLLHDISRCTTYRHSIMTYIQLFALHCEWAMPPKSTLDLVIYCHQVASDSMKKIIQIVISFRHWPSILLVVDTHDVAYYPYSHESLSFLSRYYDSSHNQVDPVTNAPPVCAVFFTLRCEDAARKRTTNVPWHVPFLPNPSSSIMCPFI